MRRTRLGPVLVALVLGGLTAGCGGSDDGPAATPPAAAPTTTTTVDAGDDCGAAAGEIEAALQVMGDVTAVEIPTCDKAVVRTSLDETGGGIATAICQNAANEASTHGVASVSVESAEGRELASGTTAEDCAEV